MSGPYHATLHTRRELEAAIGQAFGPDGTDQERCAIATIVQAHDLMRERKVHCILCDAAIARQPPYVALVVNTAAAGWGSGVICRRCGNRRSREHLATQAAQRAHLVFDAPLGRA
jgi:hypothetical protein